MHAVNEVGHILIIKSTINLLTAVMCIIYEKLRLYDF